MGFVNAKIEVENGTSIEVLFNPSEYNLSDSANYSEKTVPGYDGPITQYVSGAATTLTLTLYFDTYQAPSIDNPVEGGKDVSIHTRKLMELTKIQGSLHRPPSVTFCWGSLQFQGVVVEVRQNFTMFLSDGKPVRAKVDVTFKSVMDPKESKRKAPFESPDRTKFRTIHEKEQLWQFAYNEYGDADKWRVIAQANNISNPLNISAGQVIHLPAL